MLYILQLRRSGINDVSIIYILATIVKVVTEED